MSSPTDASSAQNGPKRSGAVKRIMQELKEIQTHQSEDFQANPLDDNLFEWHFTIRGPADTEFYGGVYHGRIMLLERFHDRPSGYPFQPPDLMLLTPSGRFEIGKKVCLSISGYHPEYWQPSWSIRTVLVALIAFMPTDPQGAIGSLNYSPEERRTMARESISWSCPTCGSSNATCFPDPLVPQILTETTGDVLIESLSSSSSSPPSSLQPRNESGNVNSNQRESDRSAEPNQSPDTAQAKPNAIDTSSADVFWTSMIVSLVLAIAGILIKKVTVA